jgi:hypothetical protein
VSEDELLTVTWKKVMPFSGSFGVKIGTPGFLFPEFLSCKDSLQLANPATFLFSTSWILVPV